MENRYRLSFTFGGLLIPETKAIVTSLFEIAPGTSAGATVVPARSTPKDDSAWDEIRSRVEKGNLLGKTRASAGYRYFREIRARLATAYLWELEIIAGVGEAAHTEHTAHSAHSAAKDTPVVLLAIVSRYYRLVGDFLAGVVRERFVSGLPELEPYMFRSFVTERLPLHPELSEISASTAEKLQTVTFRMLREAGIIPPARRGTPLRISPPEMTAILRDRYCTGGTPEDRLHLLFSSQEIQECQNR